MDASNLQVTQMRNSKKTSMTLMDVVRIVSKCTKSDHEVGLVVADLINRGRVKIRGPFQRHRLVVA